MGHMDVTVSLKTKETTVHLFSKEKTTETRYNADSSRNCPFQVYCQMKNVTVLVLQ